ncbi:MAG: acyl-CoA dehydrogenase, partial [Actinomycetota bacterium]|nr:acyl-CoA dehydrogenase [Actinomycetota bacterium]
MATNPTYEQSKEIAEASREADWTRPSFGKQLFLGSFQPELIHPQPETAPEMREKGDAFLARLRAFL